MVRKLISVFLSAILLTGSTSPLVNAVEKSNEPVVMPVMAEDSVKPEYVTDGEPTEKALEAAILAVKSKIRIPEEYSEFNYYYYGTNSYSGVYWNLNWRSKQDYSYIDVSLDKDLNFFSYSAYDYSRNERNIPAYLKSELLDEAKNFIKKIAPDIYPNIDFVEANYDSIYSNTYTYYFQRKEKGIIFPDNAVSVRVDATTGEIRSASVDWLRGAKIPSSSVKLTKEEATKS